MGKSAKDAAARTKGIAFNFCSVIDLLLVVAVALLPSLARLAGSARSTAPSENFRAAVSKMNARIHGLSGAGFSALEIIRCRAAFSGKGMLKSGRPSQAGTGAAPNWKRCETASKVTPGREEIEGRTRRSNEKG
jgi:hypothetical protein